MHGEKFLEEIEKITQSYSGEYSLLINNPSNLFKLLSNAIDEIDLEKTLRLKTLAVLGYFVLPNDLYPESELGAKGYIDDIMALIHVLKMIELEYDISSLTPLWEGTENDLQEILGVEFKKLIQQESILYNELLAYLDI